MIGRFRFNFFLFLDKLIGIKRLKSAGWQAKDAGGCLKYAVKPSIDCPIRCNGPGIVKLEGKVNLGYRKAPILGDGEILIQARKANSYISIGSNSSLSNNISIISCSRITIGKNCQIGELVSIYDSDFHEVTPETRNESMGKSIPISIGDNVWLGSRVIILKGVEIGDHSVVAAGSIVTTSIPPRSLAGGIPAKVIRNI